MNRFRKEYLLALIALLCLAPRYASAQATLSSWIPADEGNWNSDENWLDFLGDNFVPAAFVGEGASIDSGGTAVVSSMVPDILELEIDNGSVDIREGGSLAVVEEGPTTIDDNGILTISGDGRFESATAENDGIVALTSSSASFNTSGDYTQTGALQLSISGSDSPVLSVGGAASLGGTIQPDFGGAEIGFGDSWDVLTASSVSATANVVAPDTLEFGLDLQIRTDGGNASLEVVNLPILSVDRATGDVAFRNAAGGALDVVGYSIFSENELLDVDGWESLTSRNVSGWDEANPRSTAVAELNLSDMFSLTVGGDELELGSLYQQETGVKPADEDLRLEVTLADGSTTAGIVEYTGAINDLVLAVNPANGEASIQNLSLHIDPVDVVGYSIFSESGSLSVENWSSLTDQGVAGWDEANPRPEAIAEVNLDQSTVFTTGTSIDLGAISTGVEDLTFEFLTADGETLAGTVLFAESLAPVCTPINELGGDLDGDGSVAFGDFLVLSNNFGQSVSTYGEGDIDCDGTVAFGDFLVLSNNFGQSLGAGVASVPEPTTGVAIYFVLMSLCGRKRKR